ncbi:extracellular solute-binding protein, family 3 [Oceanospirillum multiglobuliferum]|uniref:Solute-binding protein family 3/N-terminal domain-containing protein n=1 Tax=Oceanospirillum multiglobuliferum TaxID=64969 RepID=A0A1T4RUH5_9GAMM|nr:transporter substrate-binding domain-containing protein [Oceanospirillum multiglobuliferum]OPX54623.1 hypothetical protein BTE48_13175 [Oceanospirillum multiglobuliferum]SKA19625.1 extracellular solute-binding protein, family 3 [Oceanospirillum multiglobuliferum]
MSLIKKAHLVLLLLLSYSATTFANSAIRLSTIEYPPLFQSEKIPGKGYGVASDLTEAAFKAAGVTIEFDYIPMIRSVESVVTERHPANLGSINWFIKDKADDLVEVVNLFNIHFMLFYKKSTFKKDIAYQALSELQIYNIGNVRGSSTTPVVTDAGLNIQWVSKLELNFRMLNADRIDFAIGGETAGWALIGKLFPDSVNKFTTVKKPILTVPIGLVFHKNQTGLIEKFNQGLDTILANGTYYEILERYYSKAQIAENLLTDNIANKAKALGVKY